MYIFLGYGNRSYHLPFPEKLADDSRLRLQNYVTCLRITVTYVGHPSLSPVTNWTVSSPQFLFWSPHLHVTVFWGGIFRKTIKVKWSHQGGTLILFHGCPCKRKTLQRSVSHARTPRKGHVRSQQGSGRRKQGEGSPQKPALWTWSGTCRL